MQLDPSGNSGILKKIPIQEGFLMFKKLGKDNNYLGNFMNIKKMLFILSMIAPCISAMDNEYTKDNDFVEDARKVASCFWDTTCPDFCVALMISKYKQECDLQPFGLEDNDCVRSKREAFRKELNKQLDKKLDSYQHRIRPDQKKEGLWYLDTKKPQQ